MSDAVSREILVPAGQTFGSGALLEREWLVTNGIGGYASGSLIGAATRRYHGLLVAALPAPHGRVVMLTQLEEQIRLPGGETIRIGGEERTEAADAAGHSTHLTRVTLEMGLPVWRYEVRGRIIEKRVHLPYLQNTVHVSYHVVSGEGPIRVRLRPLFSFRRLEARVDSSMGRAYRLHSAEDGYELEGATELPPLRLVIRGGESALVHEGMKARQAYYAVERSRGYEYLGDLYTFGYFRMNLDRGESATLIASTETWGTINALSPSEAVDSERERRNRLLQSADPRARSGSAAELVLAADQFIIRPQTRAADQARIEATGDQARTVIAGYHWFTDWGRDTMISLEGLTLTTGRAAEAGFILRTFALYVRDGLVPNMFPEGQQGGLYNTADASLWYFHAVDRYVETTNDRTTLRILLPVLRNIVDHHLRGTRFGIGMDPADALLRQGEEGYALTWMDARVGDWVVTPRRGKAVEINALWYNALRLLEGWLRGEGEAEPADALAAVADRTRGSFNERFWYERGGYLYDVIDGEEGDSTLLRPNQVLAISLRHPVLDRARWEPVMESVEHALVTPVGLRSLAPGSPDYKPQYYGDLRARDAAYHQGTVWAWLIGPFLDAWRKLHPEGDGRPYVEGFAPHLGDACIGTISEIFDAEAPYTPRGCIAQAWSVAEALRCLVSTQAFAERPPTAESPG